MQQIQQNQFSAYLSNFKNIDSTVIKKCFSECHLTFWMKKKFHFVCFSLFSNQKNFAGLWLVQLRSEKHFW